MKPLLRALSRSSGPQMPADALKRRVMSRQDAEFLPVERCDGCYLNVVGLPLCAVATGLESLGVELAPIEQRVPPCTYCGLGQPLVEISR